MKLRNILILFITAFLFAAVGCAKVKHEVVGTWYYQTLDARPQGSVTWTFSSIGELRIKSSLSGEFIEDVCNYSVSQKLFQKRVVITESNGLPGLSDFNGTYRVEEFKNDILVLIRIKDGAGEKGGAFLRCEMIRNY